MTLDAQRWEERKSFALLRGLHTKRWYWWVYSADDETAYWIVWK